MYFKRELAVDRREVLHALGYGNARADAQTQAVLESACTVLEQAARARYTSLRLSLGTGLSLGDTGLRLPGKGIARHLAGCKAVFLLALTLGGEVDAALRRAEAEDVQKAVLMDSAASTLAEQYAEEAERALRQTVEAEGEYLTGRFSPGYGDLPLGLQRDIVRLLDGPRAIGLTVNESSLLLPRKSITALLGIAGHPVQGYLAACEGCRLYEECEKRERGEYCGKKRI